MKIAVADTVVADRAQGTFLVDGEPFPWLIGDSPVATKLADGLYSVSVEIFVGLPPDDGCPLEFGGFHHDAPTPEWQQPQIAGKPFPWCITDAGIVYRSNALICAEVGLSFFTRSVSGLPIGAYLPVKGSIREAGGRVIARVGAGE